GLFDAALGKADAEARIAPARERQRARKRRAHQRTDAPPTSEREPIPLEAQPARPACRCREITLDLEHHPRRGTEALGQEHQAESVPVVAAAPERRSADLQRDRAVRIRVRQPQRAALNLDAATLPALEQP